MKYTLPIIGIVVLALIGIFFGTQSMPSTESGMEQTLTPSLEGAKEVTDGTYTLITEESSVSWAGKKPLIDGYINAGTIGFVEGAMTVENKQAQGTFVIDMNTLAVGLTAKKPGSESALEGHLKGERWFDVANNPTATVAITRVRETSESASAFVYEVTADVTLKGQTHQVVFPATIFETGDGTVAATASLQIDRTKWGITAGSSSFFDNLADNVIDDMVELTLSLKAVKQ